MQAIAVVELAGRGPIATSTARVCSSVLNWLGPCTLSSTSRSSARLGEQVDEPGRGVLGEQAGRGDPQQPAAAAGLADLEDRAVLQAEHLRGPAGQPQAARREREPDAVRTNRRSPSSLRSWPMFSDTAASETSRSTAAFLTEPSRTTAAKARSWVGVTDHPHRAQGPVRPQTYSRPTPGRSAVQPGVTRSYATVRVSVRPPAADPPISSFDGQAFSRW